MQIRKKYYLCLHSHKVNECFCEKNFLYNKISLTSIHFKDWLMHKYKNMQRRETKQ